MPINDMHKFFRTFCLATVLAAAGLFPACSNIDCPLDNVVELTCNLYTAEERTALTLTDTLTITAAGTDSVLLNRAEGISSFSLPMSYLANADTLLFRFSNTRGKAATDTLFIQHTNLPHFENLDCPASIFHQVTTVRWTSHALGLMPLTIDSVAIVRPLVNYEDLENLRIFLRSTATE